MEKLILIIFGLLLILISHPKFRMPIMSRLFNEALIIPKRIKPEKAEIIKDTGPNFSLLIIGVVLVIIGIII